MRRTDDDDVFSEPETDVEDDNDAEFPEAGGEVVEFGWQDDDESNKPDSVLELP